MTYATRREGMVLAGRVGDFVARSEKSINIFKSLPGFQGYFLLHSLGYLQKNVRLALWESREAGQAALPQSPALQTFTQANPVRELITESAPAQGYEVVLDIAGSGQAGVVTLNDWTIDVAGAVPAFVNSRNENWELAKKNNLRFVRNRLLHHLGSPNKFVAFNLATELAPFGEAPAAQRARSNFTTLPPGAERYEIVLQV